MTAGADASRERPWSGRRLHLVGVGGAGMSGYARAAHALGAERQRLRCGRRPYLERLAADGVLRRGVGHRAENLPAGDGVELVYSSAVPGRERGARRGARARAARAPARGAARRAERAAAHDRGGRHARQDDHRLDARARAARGRPGPRLARRRPARRRACQRALERGRVARGRGRRVRPLDAEPRGRDRGADERRARPSRDVRLAGGAARGVPRVPRGAARTRSIWDRPELLALRERRRRCPTTRCALDARRAGGSRFAWRGEEVRLAGPGRAQRAQRRRRARGGARSPVPTPRAAIAGLAAFAGAGPALSAARQTPRWGARLRRLRPPPDRGRGHARGARARSSRSGWWRCSSRTCTRARRCSRGVRPRRSRAPTRSSARRLPGARARRGPSRA